MSALFILIGVSIVVAGLFLAAFLWSVKNGQYDDDYTPSIRMLFDNTPEPTSIQAGAGLKENNTESPTFKKDKQAL
jgi:cbb3-type cytochrome oxidase maturation protein